ncbi:GcrA cell cycle regulator [hydrothermal vent metagenome]|uniref:GcrA cell cycle regulator n=1 Tax=hydrothermal vent metagenome TaxID=652676 RepID=A0A3B0RD60_9ZZZZ
MAWTEDRVEILKKLWIEGLSASQIATKMGGVTRNAVIGKVHRLGLSGRATPSRPPRPRIRAKAAPARARAASASGKPKTAAPAVRREETPVVPIEPKKLPSGEFATVLTLTNKLCKWPIGDPAKPGFKFCGRGSTESSPYCQDHAAQAYQPQSRRRRKPAPKAANILDSLASTRRNFN